MSTKTRILLIVGLAVLLAAGGLGAWLVVQPPGARNLLGGSAGGQVPIGGPFTLTDQHGVKRTEADLKGHYSLVYFGYTFCPDVCPTTLSAMSQAIDLLAETAPKKAAAVQPVFITIDPARDTVEEMAGYASHFHPRLMALTGTPDEIKAAAKAYRIYYQKVVQPDAGDYLMDHSSIVYLMGPDGAYVTHFTQASSAEEMAKTLADKVDLSRVAQTAAGS